ncbi:MAG: sulfurtransferase TusA family protein [Chromatiales bacterium]|nr:sulfurtransferase TusA family protein [Chromatiales bacterium]
MIKLFSLFTKDSAQPASTIHASVFEEDGIIFIDVRGQTCPGYLLAINRETDRLPPATEVALIITYPPCGDDVHAWCREKGYQFHGIEPGDGLYRIRLTT